MCLKMPLCYQHSWITPFYLGISFNLFFPHRKLKKAIDPNVIVVDLTSVLDPEIDHIRKESQRLVNKLKRKLAGDPDAEEESLEGTNIFIFLNYHPK